MNPVECKGSYVHNLVKQIEFMGLVYNIYDISYPLTAGRQQKMKG